ncbi:MAG: hypothetical protein WDN04_15500 [Rhodospirillales bacterium]
MSGESKDQWIERELGLRPAASSAAAPGIDLNTALEHWQQARADAIAQLARLADVIAARKYPESDEARALLDSVAKNLPERPATQQSIDDVQGFLLSDDILDDAEAPNGFGFAVDVRSPLMLALGDLKDALRS